MAHYAELNENNEVIFVIYLNNETITDENGNEVDKLGLNHLHTVHGEERKWVRTSYGGNFRNKYACIGDTYREDLDMFIRPQPFASWTLNESIGEWEPPFTQPDLTEEEREIGGLYQWNEELYQSDNTKGWVLITPETYSSQT